MASAGISSQHGVQTGPQLAQQGRRHGFADTGTPHEEADSTVQHRAVFQFAQLPAHGLEGLVRTDGETAAAAVAHVGKDADIAGKGGDGLEAADLAAFAALAARGQIEGRNFQPGLAAPSTCGGRKRWRLGASTSVSTATRGLSQTLAREAATLVLPAPPLPLAMAIRIRVLYLLGASAKGNSPFWKRSTASRTVPLTSWQTLMPAAFRASKALGPT